MKVLILVLLTAAACGHTTDDGELAPDAGTGDAAIDAPADAPADAPVGCAAIIGGQPDGDPINAATGAIVGRSIGQPWRVGCTGTLISPTTVLTAAHCLSPQIVGNRQLGFALGTNLTQVSNTQVHVEAQRIVHPMFFPQNLGQGLSNDTYDVALLILATPVSGVTPAKVARAQDATLIAQGTTVRIVGYGVTTNQGQDLGTKRSATTVLGTVQPAEMIVGAPGMPQKCNGDSGGPTFLDVVQQCVATPRIIGLTSRAADVAANCTQPGIDTRVSYHLAWLGSVTQFGCDSGPNTTPCP